MGMFGTLWTSGTLGTLETSGTLGILGTVLGILGTVGILRISGNIWESLEISGYPGIWVK